MRASRTGDRFHYFWASRRALRLLDSTSELLKVGVEGTADADEVAGEEVIDVAEYYGDRTSGVVALVRYVQLKHSSLRTDDFIVASELKNTLTKFGQNFRVSREANDPRRFEFAIVTNRELNEKVRLSLTEIAAGSTTPTHPAEAAYLRQCMGFGNDAAREIEFCSLLTVEDNAADIDDVERMLQEELNQYLPGGGAGSELAVLMNEISRLATTQATSQILTKSKLLLLLRTNEHDLFPAPPQFEEIADVIKTNDVDEIVGLLRGPGASKILLTAVGGVGKSVLTRLLSEELSAVEGSVVVKFDCFAGGNYRKVTEKRHRHEVALTQIINEIATNGLCDILIPSPIANERQYVRTFMLKLRQASERLAIMKPEALITVIVDAADNAAIAASEHGDRSFVGDLFSEEWPANARLVALCRPERSDLLGLPSQVPHRPLEGFQKSETIAHLRTRFPDASAGQGVHFHAVSSGNPRVQAMAMDVASTPDGALAALDRVQAGNGEPLDELLAAQIQAVADHGQLAPDALNRLCQALATLHPTVPLSVLAEIASLSEDSIRSFAAALGRGLHLTAEAVQFRDEPTETWFRNKHGLNAVEKREFARRVAPIAERSAYVANVLPQVYFEADMLDELLSLALSEENLPADAFELQRQEIARSRARFALGAALKAGRTADGALISVRAGTLSSGRARKLAMIRTHTDLTAEFADRTVVEGLCAGRELASDWPGSNLHVEAALLSHLRGEEDTARARLNSAHGNFVAILRLSQEDSVRIGANVGANEVADLAMAAINLGGARAVLQYLKAWRTDFSRLVARKLAARLADAGRLDDLSALVIAAKKRRYVRLAVAETMFDYGIAPSDEATASLVKTLRKQDKAFRPPWNRMYAEADVRGVVWGLLHGLRLALVEPAEALNILNRHLPEKLDDGVGGRHYGLSVMHLLVGYALRSRLSGTALEARDLAGSDLLKELDKPARPESRRGRDFTANIPALLPWASCLVDATIDGHTEEVVALLRRLFDQDLKSVSEYQTPFVLVNGLAELSVRILALVPEADLIGRFLAWHQAADESLSRSRLAVIRNAARCTDLATLGIRVANRGHDLAQGDRTDADSRVETLLDIARAVLATSRSEAEALFNAADVEAERVGDDMYARWNALTTTAGALKSEDQSERAYRLFQIGETLDTVLDLNPDDLAVPLYAMHPSGYCSLLSRSRDRRRLDFDRMLRPLFQNSSGENGVVGRLCLYAFGAGLPWRTVMLDLEGEQAAHLVEVLEDFTRYHRDGTEVPDESYSSSSEYQSNERKAYDPMALFGDADFTTEEAWADAFDRTPAYYPDQRQTLIEFAMGKHEAAVPNVLEALSNSPRAEVRDYTLAAKWVAGQESTVGLRAASGRFARSFSTRFAREISTRSYDRPEVEEFAASVGVPVESIMADALMEVGASAHQLSYREFFSLAARIATTLSEAECSRVFDSLAELFDDIAPADTSSDGPYDRVPAPPEDPHEGMAGLVWSALGDMAVKRRWEASHAVCLLVRIGATEILEGLAGFAAGNLNADSFHDMRFPPYVLHSRFWLLLALDRAASEPEATNLFPFVDWLVDVVRGPRHAAHQFLAQRALQTLVDGGIATLDDPSLLAASLLPEVEDLDWEAKRARPDVLADRAALIDESRSYPFFMDFRKYWCRELASIFGATEQSVASVAVEVASGLTGFGDDMFSRDPRRVAGVFGEYTSHSHHHSWPEEEDFDFYSGVHALLALGAQLAESQVAAKEPGEAADMYTQWLNEYLPKRFDGRWLSDFRDAPPVPAPEKRLADQSPPNLWPWTITPADFERIVGAGTDWITVHSAGYVGFRDMGENQAVYSAFVPHETAQSFLVALQTNPHGPRVEAFPTADSPEEDRFGEEIDKGPYQLTGWIDTSEYQDGIDKDDERGQNLRFPPPRPGRDIVERFGLRTDPDYRSWRTEDLEAFKSTRWSDTHKGYYDYDTGTHGHQLVVNRDFLQRVLQEFDRTLVIQVELRREMHRASYQRRREDEFDYLEWSSKVYLFGPTGQWTEY